MKIVFLNKQKEFLENHIKNKTLKKKIKESKACVYGKRHEIDINAEQKEILEKELLFLFCELGLDEDDEANEMGIFIESIIDTVFDSDIEI